MKKYATNNGVWDVNKVLASPLLSTLQPVLEVASWPAQGWPTAEDYQNLLQKYSVRNSRGRNLKVVPMAASPDSMHRPYEASMYFDAALNTRLENWHDCFNLLTWCTFPLSKAALNAAHMRLQSGIDVRVNAPARMPAQDALTQFDESGVVLACADSELIDLLEAFQWKRVFWEKRGSVHAALRCYVFGHGIMEKALHPYVGLTAKALILLVERDFMQASLNEQLIAVDKQVAAFINRPQPWSSARDLLPLPILGVPGYSPDNAQQAYYDNVNYFRPGRRHLT